MTNIGCDPKCGQCHFHYVGSTRGISASFDIEFYFNCHPNRCAATVRLGSAAKYCEARGARRGCPRADRLNRQLRLQLPAAGDRSFSLSVLAVSTAAAAAEEIF